MRFADRTALISAAGAGIGKATAEIISREGGTVVAVDIDASRLEALAAAEVRIVPRTVDGRDEAAVRALVGETVSDRGGIDILVNAVGGSTIIDAPDAGVDAMTLGEWQALIDFNLTATFLFTNAVVPHMKAAGGGKIVNLASIAGRGLSGSSSSAYAAAKGGIIAMTRKLGHELGPHRINVNAIAPSLTLTERLLPHWERRSPESRAEEVARVPLGRIATAADQARVAAFLASGDADFVNGVTIDVTGGM